MIKIGLIASGSGSNAESIMKACEKGILKDKAEIVVLISNKANAFCLERAKKHNIPNILISSINFSGSREDFDRLVTKELKKYGAELICLVGYMRLVSPYFLNEFKNKVMNIHPALLPSFAGIHGYKDAIDYGVKWSGCTVHFVDEKMDNGPIIIQKVLEVFFDDTEDSLKERGLKLEHKAFPEAIELYCDGKLKIVGRKVQILK